MEELVKGSRLREGSKPRNYGFRNRQGVARAYRERGAEIENASRSGFPILCGGVQKVNYLEISFSFMDILNFAATVVLITASGALAPGPLFFVTVSHGAKLGAKSGLAFSVAHNLVEFPLVMLLAFGLITVADELIVKLAIGVVGGAVLLAFGALQIRDSLKSEFGKAASGKASTGNLLLIGLAFTGLNPFFIIWWLTVGASLVLLSLEFASLAGVVFMYLCHVWMDYLWLTAVAHFAKKGMNVIGFKWYRAMMTIFGVVLIYFGLNFLLNSLSLY